MKYLKYFEQHKSSKLLELPNIPVSGEFNSIPKLSTLVGCPKNIFSPFNTGDDNMIFIKMCILTFGVDNILNLEEYNIKNPIQNTKNDLILNTISIYKYNLNDPIIKMTYKDDKEEFKTFNIMDRIISKNLSDNLKNIYGSYEFQKDYLTKTPEKYIDLEFIGYNDEIKKEFDWLFNAVDMGIM